MRVVSDIWESGERDLGEGEKGTKICVYIQFSLALYKHKRNLYICVCIKVREASESGEREIQGEANGNCLPRVTIKSKFAILYSLRFTKNDLLSFLVSLKKNDLFPFLVTFYFLLST